MASRTTPAARIAVVCAAASLFGVVSALLVWWALAPTQPAAPGVPFAAFLSAVTLGEVDEVRIDGTLYTFRSHDESQPRGVLRQAIGPVPDLAQIRALRPSSADRRPPKIYFER